MVLTATADTQAQLEAPALQQLQVLLRGELAKELASSTIARDDTMAVLKKKEKQRKRCVDWLWFKNPSCVTQETQENAFGLGGGGYLLLSLCLIPS
jgi:hypothetical protein